MWVWLVLAFLAGAVTSPIMFAAVLIGRSTRHVKGWADEQEQQ